eukprot:541009-Amorphochlora_amoeboformis.AAC.1
MTHYPPKHPSQIPVGRREREKELAIKIPIPGISRVVTGRGERKAGGERLGCRSYTCAYVY